MFILFVIVINNNIFNSKRFANQTIVKDILKIPENNPDYL